MSTRTPTPPSDLPPWRPVSAPTVLPGPRRPADTSHVLIGLPGNADPAGPPPRPRLFRLLLLSVAAGLLVALVSLPVVGGVGLGAKATADSFNDLPTELVVPPLPERSIVTDRVGNRIAYFHGAEDRVNVPLARIPVALRQAIIAIEDRRFYEHHGVDYKGVVRAAVTNQENGAITQGGSTLTQQYVKNVLITLADSDEGRDAAQERSVRRKLREARYALALEKRLSKDQILTNYLNIAYFGDGAYGVAAAAQHYFGKDVSALNPVESATLAGLVQNPNAYNPKLRPQLAKERRNLVLAAMRDAGFLTEPAARYGAALPVVVRKATTVSDGCETAGSAAFYCQYLRQTLLSDPAFGPTPEERQRRLFEGGLQIRTSLDPAVQAAAQKAADGIVPAGNRVATAVVILQPGTGEVQAMAVNRVYGPTADGKPVQTTSDRVHTKLNYALSSFQPGSTFKAFTLAAALESGMPLSTTYNSPVCYASRTLNNPAAGCYKNAGDSESGVFAMPEATWHSVNTYFIQLEERAGVLKVRDMAKRLGVSSPRLDQVGVADGSLTLGGFEVTPMDMAVAYATFAAHGKRCDPKPVLAVRERSRAASYQGPGGCAQVLDPAIADTISSMLQGVIREGTARANGSIGRPAAGKTGTTEENRSAWFVGYVPQLASAVWVGDYRSPDQFPLRYSPTTPEGVPVPGWKQGTVYGGDLPTQVWSRALREATQGLPVEEFAVPGRITARSDAVGVPSVLGQTQDSAFAALRSAGFEPVAGNRVTSEMTVGLVASTSPGAGADIAPGSRVVVHLSSGPAHRSPAEPVEPEPSAAVVPVAPTQPAGPPTPMPSVAAPSPPAPGPGAEPGAASPSPRPTVSATPARPQPSPTPSRTRPGRPNRG